MNTDNKSINTNIHLPNHYRKRYKERVSKSSKGALDFAKKSYLMGKDIEQIEDKEMRTFLQKKSKKHGYICKVYRGFACWFWSNSAITIYRLPILNKKGEYYEKDA